MKENSNKDSKWCEIAILLPNPNLSKIATSVYRELVIKGFDCAIIVSDYMSKYDLYKELHKNYKTIKFPIKKRKRRGKFGYKISMLLSFVELSKKLTFRPFDYLIVFADSTGLSKLLLVWSKPHNIPVICIQEGLAVSTLIKSNHTSLLKRLTLKILTKIDYKNMITLFYNGILGSFSDYNIVYGYAKKKALIDTGIESNKIFITGNPLFDHLNLKELKSMNSNLKVLYVHQPLKYNQRLELKYLEYLYKSCLLLDGCMLSFKIHPRAKKSNKSVINALKSFNTSKLNIEFIGDGDVQDIIKNYGVLITSHSSAVYRAFVEGVPVILLNGLQNEHKLNFFEGCIKVSNPKELLGIIPTILLDKTYRSNLKVRMKETINKHLFKIDGKASLRVACVIQKIAIMNQ